MQRIDRNSRNRSKRSALRGIWGKIDEVILADFMGEMGWMLVLGAAVLLCLGVIYLFSLRA